MPVSTVQLPVQHQYRRGPSTDMAGFVGYPGEITVDTTYFREVIHDGATAGGWPMGRASFTSVKDSTYTVVATDGVVMYTTLTASRTVTLISAAAYPTGQRLTICDGTGQSSLFNITVNTASSLELVVGATSATISTGWGHMTLLSNGSSKWSKA